MIPRAFITFGGARLDSPSFEAAPDHMTQLEEILSHIRRCERWAHLDDRIDLAWRLNQPRWRSS
jgi:hypothetical protein